ncbi:MAG: S8 family serine peptidase [Phycisphaerales bacterium]|nr:S8 family serine peptidase [Phycisphaerales bacterium]MCI0630254.1 S8 family serine peptidase [Phycisphaerales bacterium]
MKFRTIRLGMIGATSAALLLLNVGGWVDAGASAPANDLPTAWNEAPIAGKVGQAKEITIDESDAVWSTFVADGVGDEAGLIKAANPAAAPNAIVIPDWDRPAPQIPPELIGAPTPSYYVYNGQARLLNLDPTRLAVRLRDQAAPQDPRDIALEAGIAASASWAPGVDRWHLLTLQQPLLDAADADQKINALVKHNAIEFASPVFHSPDVVGGWLTITPDVLVRLRADFVANGAAILAQAAPELAIFNDNFGLLPGAYQLRSAARNGFEVLASANRLAIDPRFAWSEPDILGAMDLHQFFPNDPGFDVCWGIHNTGQDWDPPIPDGIPDMDMDGPEAWEITRGMSYVQVLVMDTGVEQDHPDINQNTGRDFTTGAPGGVPDGDPVGACDDHGTAVAGCISAFINNNLGTTGIAGGARAVSARIGSQETNPCSSFFATYQPSWVVNALAWGYGQAVRITNASFGVPVSSAMEDEYNFTYNNGIVHFASAGNGSMGSLGFPSSIENVNAVAALDPDGTLASFSNWGPGLDYSAPGVNVWTTDRTGAPGYSNGDYTYFGGTSAASPYAAGATALFISAFPDSTVFITELWMEVGAVDLGVNGYDNTYGWGFINPNVSLGIPGPSNEFCANATLINTTTYNPGLVSTTGAFAFPGEPQENCEVGDVGVSNSVWYDYTPPCDGYFNINTNGSDYDTVLSVFTGSCVPVFFGTFLIACDDDSGIGLQSQLTNVEVAGGITYHIKVADYDTTPEGGDLDFNFAFSTDPIINDSCFSATAINTNNYNPPNFCTIEATAGLCDGNETCVSDAAGVSNSIWYSFSPQCNGTISINTIGSDYDTVLSVYTGCPFIILPSGNCIQPTQLACNDDISPGNLDSQILNLPVTQGTTYRIKVGDYDSTPEGGTLDLNFSFTKAGGEADVNCDGVVNILDLLAVIGSWGNCPLPCPPVCATDVTQDCIVNVQDLLAVIAAWGT